jgi:hypothetical protein
MHYTMKSEVPLDKDRADILVLIVSYYFFII